MPLPPFWKQSSSTQRIAFVGYVVGFVVFVVSGLALDRTAADAYPLWQALSTTLGVVLPLYAIWLGWWIGRIDTIPLEPGKGIRSWRFPARMAYVMFFGLFWITRRARGVHNGAIEIALLAWWLVAMAVLVLVVPRVVRTSASAAERPT